MEGGTRVSTTDYFKPVLTFLERAAQAQGVQLPGESASLFEHGVMDSFGLLEFIAFLEETFIMRIADEDLTPDRFASIRKIREYIEHRARH
jgi:acyl carrier protein